MSDDFEILKILKRYCVPFVVIGGHAVNFHGYTRATEDTDVVWLRSGDSEQALLCALNEIDAQYIGKEIDPATKIERTYPVTLSFIRSSHLMMLWTRYGFLDLFDYVPGVLTEEPATLLSTSVESDGLRYVSLEWLRKLKKASGRTKDLLDLDNLP